MQNNFSMSISRLLKIDEIRKYANIEIKYLVETDIRYKFDYCQQSHFSYVN